MSRIKHEGINKHRLPDSPREAIFAREWALQASRTLPYLLCGQDATKHELTQHDATVAATVIQWLGSPVGTSFLDEVQSKIKKMLP